MTILKIQDVMLLLLKLVIIFSQYFGLDRCQCLCSINVISCCLCVLF